MELVRVTHADEMYASEKEIRALFKKYIERVSGYKNKKGENEFQEINSEEIFWQDTVFRVKFHDYYFYLIRDDDKWIGFFIGSLVRVQYFTYMFTHEIYTPGKGKIFGEILKYVGQALGVDEFFGEAPPRIHRTYRRLLPNAKIKFKTMVMVKL